MRLGLFLAALIVMSTAVSEASEVVSNSPVSPLTTICWPFLSTSTIRRAAVRRSG